MTDARFPDLADARVFVTGGASGIGAALVAGFLQQGAQVSFVDITGVDAFADRMADATGRRPFGQTCDVTDTAAFQAAMDRAAEVMGGLTVMVNNAANDTRYAAEDITPEVWQNMLSVNLSSVFFGCQHAATLMTAGGSIINYSSITMQMGPPDMSAYVAAKAGIVGLTRSLAREWGPRGIRVNAIAPGWVMTERQRRLWATPEAEAAFLDKQCLKRQMDASDMVGPTLFLASSASGMVTSQTLVVDAGVVNH